ncbi:AsnC family transcriptional regulator [Roseiarcus fermentans]|uniref:AsnC family transcriptional regulator n=2 Tax=Roseiarcus fermentans TaxID=1473586 RepID=A0A366ELG9_9HYPH|nr:AsnC family transcriptional regulator [Roseiarcus fermentans]
MTIVRHYGAFAAHVFADFRLHPGACSHKIAPKPQAGSVFVRMDDLDDFDRAILRELMRDGRMSNADLAERIHLSPSACLRRVRALEEMGVIAGYVMLIDADKAGLAGAAFVFVTLEQQGRAMLDAFERDVGRHPEITECHLLAGVADYLLRVVFRDSRDFERIHTEILTQLPGVSRVQSTLPLRTVKQTTALPI